MRGNLGRAPSCVLEFGIAMLLGAAVALFATKDKRTLPKKRARVLGVIPARYESQRFPGKPLVDILGKPMVVRTWEQAKKAASLDSVVVATDDERIAKVCRQAGAKVVMTSADCSNGTERCHEAASKLEKEGMEFDIVINIQGDEPLIDPEIINRCVHALKSAPNAMYSTACTAMETNDVSVELHHRVKVILDQDDCAIYFSRGMLPSNKTGRPQQFPAPFQLSEDLEQLKVIEHGYRIKVVTVDHCAHGVDTPGDVDSIIATMRENDWH